MNANLARSIATRPLALCTTVLAAALALGGCAASSDDWRTPVPDQNISQEEVTTGDQAVAAISNGASDPAFDNGEPTADTEGDQTGVAPPAQEPSAAEIAADMSLPPEAEGAGEQLASGTPDPTTELAEESPLAADADNDPTTGTSVAQLRACRPARGYIRGRGYSICVTEVNGKLVGNRTAHAFVRMRAAAARAGVHLVIVSGFRTMAQQRYLWNLYQQGRGNLAARPGYSNHQSGIALDLNTSASGVYRWLTNNGRRFGFVRTVPSEIWHWEYRP